MAKTIKELCEFMWYLEDKYGLLDMEISGVKVWQYKRSEIYQILGKKAGVFETPHTIFSKKKKLNSFWYYVKNSLLKNPFFSKKTEIVLYSHNRSKLVNSEYIDIYTYYLKRDFNQDDYIELESPYLGKHIRNPDKNIKYTDFILVCESIFNRFVKIDIPSSTLKVLNEVKTEISSKLSVDFDLTPYFIQKAKRFIVNYRLYKRLFKRIKPKTLYIVVAYAYGDIIKAAKDSNIQVKELQHGAFSQYHLGYSFPNRNSPLEYFPDQFMVWNTYWKNAIRWPIPNDDILIHPFQYLEETKQNYQHISKKRDNIVVISQGTVTNELARVMLNQFTKFENMTIHYKLHPGEYDQWEKNDRLFELSQKDNVQIILDGDLYELFATCEYQLGVYSTALFEGIEFECKTILANITGVEWMKSFIKNYNMVLDGFFYVQKNKHEF